MIDFPPFLDHNRFVSAREAAERMGLTEVQVASLVKGGVLRRDRWGDVEPALLSGAV